jgi:hypothetical protein
MKATIEDVQDVKIEQSELTDTKRYRAIIKGKLLLYKTDGFFRYHLSEAEFRQFAVDAYNSEQ